jgi:hypothetical protein
MTKSAMAYPPDIFHRRKVGGFDAPPPQRIA